MSIIGKSVKIIGGPNAGLRGVVEGADVNPVDGRDYLTVRQAPSRFGVRIHVRLDQVAATCKACQGTGETAGWPGSGPCDCCRGSGTD